MKSSNQVKAEAWLPLRGRWLGYFWLGLAYLVLVPLLLAAVWPRVFETRIISQGDPTSAQIHLFETALELYCADHGGQPPTTAQGLTALIQPPLSGLDGQWQGPYVNDLTSIPADEWGRPYHYQSPGPNGEAYQITSYGADGRPGGTGDDEDLFSRHSLP